MKSEQEIIDMANAILKQARTISIKSKNYNPTAFKILEQRALTLFWVLDKTPNKEVKVLKTLTLNQDMLKVLSCLY